MAKKTERRCCGTGVGYEWPFAMSKLPGAWGTSRKIVLSRETLSNPHFGRFRRTRRLGGEFAIWRNPLWHKGFQHRDPGAWGGAKRRFVVLAWLATAFLHSPRRKAPRYFPDMRSLGERGLRTDVGE